jgi:hypothetical protein
MAVPQARDQLTALLADSGQTQHALDDVFTSVICGFDHPPVPAEEPMVIFNERQRAPMVAVPGSASAWHGRASVISGMVGRRFRGHGIEKKDRRLSTGVDFPP